MRLQVEIETDTGLNVTESQIIFALRDILPEDKWTVRPLPAQESGHRCKQFREDEIIYHLGENRDSQWEMTAPTLEHFVRNLNACILAHSQQSQPNPAQDQKDWPVCAHGIDIDKSCDQCEYPEYVPAKPAPEKAERVDLGPLRDWMDSVAMQYHVSSPVYTAYNAAVKCIDALERRINNDN